MIASIMTGIIGLLGIILSIMLIVIIVSLIKRDWEFLKQIGVITGITFAIMLGLVYLVPKDSINTSKVNEDTKIPATEDSEESQENKNNTDINKFKPVYKIISEEDISIQGIKRYRIKIHVPLGLSKEELEFNLKQSAESAFEKLNPNALMVFAYREDDERKEDYSAGRAILAPYGDWDKADQDVSYKKYDMVIDVSDTYLNPKETVEIGSAVQFAGEVSNKSESWDIENIIINIPDLTNAKILEIKKFPIGQMESIRYKIEFPYEGGTISGWIHDYDIKK